MADRSHDQQSRCYLWSRRECRPGVLVRFVLHRLNGFFELVPGQSGGSQRLTGCPDGGVREIGGVRKIGGVRRFIGFWWRRIRRYCVPTPKFTGQSLDLRTQCIELRTEHSQVRNEKPSDGTNQHVKEVSRGISQACADECPDNWKNDSRNWGHNRPSMGIFL